MENTENITNSTDVVIATKSSQITALLNKRAHLIKTVDKKQKERDEIRGQVEEFSKFVGTKNFNTFESSFESFRKFKNLCADILKNKNLSESQAKEFKLITSIEGIEDDLSDVFSGNDAREAFLNNAKKTFDDLGMGDLFEEMKAKAMNGGAFKDEPIEKDRDIRSAYLKLATQFHPDKANNSEEAAELNELMSKLNKLYENNDLAGLLAFERDNSSNNSTTNFDDEELIRINKELVLLEKQLITVKQELKELKSSQEWKDIKLAKKSGMTLEEFAVSNEICAPIPEESIKDIINILEDFNTDKIDFEELVDRFEKLEMENQPNLGLEDSDDTMTFEELFESEEFLNEMLKAFSGGSKGNNKKKTQKKRK